MVRNDNSNVIETCTGIARYKPSTNANGEFELRVLCTHICCRPDLGVLKLGKKGRPIFKCAIEGYYKCEDGVWRLPNRTKKQLKRGEKVRLRRDPMRACYGGPSQAYVGFVSKTDKTKAVFVLPRINLGPPRYIECPRCERISMILPEDYKPYLLQEYCPEP